MSSEELTQFSRLEQIGDSDHFLILINFKIERKTQIIK